jgi:hypothetical protein
MLVGVGECLRLKVNRLSGLQSLFFDSCDGSTRVIVKDVESSRKTLKARGSERIGTDRNERLGCSRSGTGPKQDGSRC